MACPGSSCMHWRLILKERNHVKYVTFLSHFPLNLPVNQLLEIFGQCRWGKMWACHWPEPRVQICKEITQLHHFYPTWGSNWGVYAFFQQWKKMWCFCGLNMKINMCTACKDHERILLSFAFVCFLYVWLAKKTKKNQKTPIWAHGWWAITWEVMGSIGSPFISVPGSVPYK